MADMVGEDLIEYDYDPEFQDLSLGDAFGTAAAEIDKAARLAKNHIAIAKQPAVGCVLMRDA